MFKLLEQVRIPTLDLPVEARRKLWFEPFMQSYLVVFIWLLTMYPDPQELQHRPERHDPGVRSLHDRTRHDIGLGFPSPTGWGKTVVSYYADGKNTKQFLPLMLILSALSHVGLPVPAWGPGFSLYFMIFFYAQRLPRAVVARSYSTITKWTPQQARHLSRHVWNLSHNVGGAGAAGVALLFGANYLFDGNVLGMFIFHPSSRLIVGFIGLRFGSDSAGASMVWARWRELFDEVASEGT